MIEYSFSPTGILYRSKQNQLDRFVLKVDLKDNLIQQIKPLPNKLFRPNDGWKKTNEPEEHLNEIAEQISGEVRDPRILCFSYKDESLAKRLTPERDKYDILFDEECGIIKRSPDEVTFTDFKNAIDRQLHNYNLFLMRHYLEHFIGAEKVIKSLSNSINIIEGLYAYVEVPDCGKFIDERNPLFLWEQHKVYFTDASINYQFYKSKMSVAFGGRYGDSIEPSLCYLLCKQKKEDNKKTSNEITTMKNNLGELSEYTEKWNKYLKSLKKPKVLYGIGHNSDRFLQFTNTSRYFDYFVDGNPTKKNLYLADATKRVSNNIPLTSDCEVEVIIGVHDRNYESVSTRIKIEYPQAKISSIFSYPKP